MGMFGRNCKTFYMTLVLHPCTHLAALWTASMRDWFDIALIAVATLALIAVVVWQQVHSVALT